MSQVAWRVPLADLRIDDEIVDRAVGVIRSGWWSMGPQVAELEERFGAFCGVRHACAVSSGTAALHLALLATGCGPGDEVVLPALNFVAAANVIGLTGARPVFCDVVGGADLNLDPQDLEGAVGPATKALLILHYGGAPCDVRAVREIADRHGLVVIEDAAHAPGASLGNRMTGGFGDVACFSFFSNKNLSTGEGGMVTTDDDEIARRVRLLRSHGMTALTWDRHRGHAHSYDVLAQGLNYRMDEMRSAIGMLQLERLPAGNAERGEHVARYREALDGWEGAQIAMPERPDAVSAHHLAVAILPQGRARADFRTHLAEQRIQTSVHYPPIYRFTHYERGRRRALPQTDAVADRLVTLPLFPHMSTDQRNAVVAATREWLSADVAPPEPSETAR